MALPLVARGRLLGVVHVHAMEPGAELEADTEVLQLVADQLASAMDTSRLFGESRQALQQLEAASGRTTQLGWLERTLNEAMAYEYTRAGVRPTEPGAAAGGEGGLRVPLELRGQQIGVITLNRHGDLAWTETDRELAQKTAAQVALALENVRLLDETRQRAVQEQMLSEFSARLSQSVDLDTLLQTAARELAALPEVADASVYLGPSEVETPPAMGPHR
jgi:GAF domain-containing protein